MSRAPITKLDLVGIVGLTRNCRIGVGSRCMNATLGVGCLFARVVMPGGHVPGSQPEQLAQTAGDDSNLCAASAGSWQHRLSCWRSVGPELRITLPGPDRAGYFGAILLEPIASGVEASLAITSFFMPSCAMLSWCFIAS